jgi:anaerobic magnesium-protoporphyrin IX monomethyl ester cyclase
MIVTIPLRDLPQSGTPYGALTIINYIRKGGYNDIELYHIDENRPSFEDAIAHIVKEKPDILGISAIVSTAYDYTKRLSQNVKKLLPETLVVVGGNMGASAEILLRKTGTDIVILGEGEKAFLNVVRHSETTHNPADFAHIKGLAVVDQNDQLVNTGYETPMPVEEIWDCDFRDLEHATDINKIFYKAFDKNGLAADWIMNDPRGSEPHRRDKTIGQIACVKGCVAKCTFCHRWDKGIKHISIARIMKELDHHIEKYDVGFVMIFAETFGNDKRWLEEFCKEIKKRDVLWWSGGLRANAAAATPEWIEIMKDSGCACLTYGNETGSEKMLQVMEKKVSLEDNYNSMKWTIEAGIHTGIQLVIGMPGETDETIDETIKYCNYVTTLSADKDPNYMSSNYAQALPGTPLYEFGRHKGWIGQDIDGEEAYLMSISDRNARDEKTTLNFTDSSTLICRTWRPRITIEVNYNFVKTFGLDQYLKVITATRGFQDMIVSTPGLASRSVATKNHGIPGLFYLMSRRYMGLAMISYPVFFYRLQSLLPLMILAVSLRDEGLKGPLKLLRGHIIHKVRSLGALKRRFDNYKSLRKIVSNDLGVIPSDSAEMQSLRDGR